jgi:hypothetical protein
MCHDEFPFSLEAFFSEDAGRKTPDLKEITA